MSNDKQEFVTNGSHFMPKSEWDLYKKLEREEVLNRLVKLYHKTIVGKRSDSEKQLILETVGKIALELQEDLLKLVQHGK